MTWSVGSIYDIWACLITISAVTGLRLPTLPDSVLRFHIKVIGQKQTFQLLSHIVVCDVITIITADMNRYTR
jgi:hypothetical protein